ncbi:citrate synthase/methylcitrate synthase [Mariluticola halotolerans]|uniref:citrate synthase/methylcitrate synthase n=1 Tax=Mariluticola halotolerans TaxID=2909283 RepID=UPI0026E2B696|nr:citrate synthase/methylcitrate synthase [Mariluticola halotolerans]UJQ94925.1 citrate synthase/methylcitrate synthase [Mariluticola halotolerans]
MTNGNGLEDVIAADTAMSDVDGFAGRLIIRGVSLDQLIKGGKYEDVIALLLDGQFPDLPAGQDLQKALGAARTKAFLLLETGESSIADLPLFDGVRALTARLSDDQSLETALTLIAAPAVFTPGLLRLKAGKQPLAPDAALPHAVDILRMHTSQHPRPQQIAALDRYLLTVTDHGLNASTFAARVVASTAAGLNSCVLGALGALKGPLHGGAPGPVLDMLDAIGTPSNAETWLENAMARGDRLMGFGHRIYRVRDPRADALKAGLANLAAEGSIDSDRLILAETIETAALALLARKKPDRALETNVEFYTALLLEALGFPRAAFTCVFAMGRTTGWIAHAREQAENGRLIRPKARYIGPMPEKAA